MVQSFRSTPAASHSKETNDRVSCFPFLYCSFLNDSLLFFKFPAKMLTLYSENECVTKGTGQWIINSGLQPCQEWQHCQQLVWVSTHI